MKKKDMLALWKELKGRPLDLQEFENWSIDSMNLHLTIL